MLNEIERNEIEALLEKKSQLATVKKVEINIKDEPKKLIEDIHNTQVVKQVMEDQSTNELLKKQADKTIKTTLNKLEQEQNKDLQKAAYDANAEACTNFGISKDVPLWQIKMMVFGSAIWFVIYYIVAMFTICPISVFTKGLNTFIKNTWIALLVAALLYAFIAIGLPLITKYLIGG